MHVYLHDTLHVNVAHLLLLRTGPVSLRLCVASLRIRDITPAQHLHPDFRPPARGGSLLRAVVWLWCSLKHTKHWQEKKKLHFRRQFNEKPSTIPGCPETPSIALTV